MKNRPIGVFRLGPENVRVFIDVADRSSEAVLTPADDGCATMTIGLADPEWGVAVAGLLHESFEFLLVRRGLAYERMFTICHNEARGVFMFDHTRFSEIACDVADFMAAVLPALKAAHGVAHAPKPEKQTRRRSR